MFASVSDTQCFCQCIPLLSRFGNTWLLYIFHMHARMALILRAGAGARWQILHCLQTQTSPSVSPDNAYEVDFTLGRLIPASRPDASRWDAKHTHGHASTHARVHIHQYVRYNYTQYVLFPQHTHMNALIHTYTHMLRVYLYAHTHLCYTCLIYIYIHYLCLYYAPHICIHINTYRIYLCIQIHAVLLHIYTHTHTFIYLYSVSCQRLQTHTNVYIINTDLHIIVAHMGVHVNRSSLNRCIHLRRQRLMSAHSISRTHTHTRVEHTACGRSCCTYLRVFAPESEGR